MAAAMPALTLVQMPLPCTPEAVIDVRSPAEFAEDHMPGAINLPVLRDDERITIGTLYKQQSAFTAKRAGAVLVSRNIATILESYFADKRKTFSPLLYCARGGQRSHSLATVLGAVGWRVMLLEGGYKTYRRHVLDSLQRLAPQLQFRALNGLTGSGKTALLKHLSNSGRQVLDLEDLAAHRSSLLGRYTDRPQPSQCAFESSIFAILTAMDPQLPVYVEAESRKVGNLQIPDALWFQLVQAPVVELQVPEQSRVTHLMEEYAHFLHSPEWCAHLKERLDVLRARYGHEQVDSWHSMADAGQWPTLTHSLLRVHYDPMYRSGGRYTAPFAKLSLAHVAEPDHATALQELDALHW
jgi:tRNA 2-selenouridine synthase